MATLQQWLDDAARAELVRLVGLVVDYRAGVDSQYVIERGQHVPGGVGSADRRFAARCRGADDLPGSEAAAGEQGPAGGGLRTRKLWKSPRRKAASLANDSTSNQWQRSCLAPSGYFIRVQRRQQV